MKIVLFIIVIGASVSLFCQNREKNRAVTIVSQKLRSDSSLLFDVYKLKKGKLNLNKISRRFVKENTQNNNLAIFMLPTNYFPDTFVKFNDLIDTSMNINDGISYSDCNIIAILFLIDTDPIVIKADIIYRKKRLTKYGEKEFFIQYFESGTYMFGTHVFYTFFFEKDTIRINRDIIQLF